MNLTVNAESITTTTTTLAGLLEEILGQLPDAGVAVAVEGEVVPRSEWDRPLSEGQNVDILSAVQGG